MYALLKFAQIHIKVEVKLGKPGFILAAKIIVPQQVCGIVQRLEKRALQCLTWPWSQVLLHLACLQSGGVHLILPQGWCNTKYEQQVNSRIHLLEISQ